MGSQCKADGFEVPDIKIKFTKLFINGQFVDAVSGLCSILFDQTKDLRSTMYCRTKDLCSVMALRSAKHDRMNALLRSNKTEQKPFVWLNRTEGCQKGNGGPKRAGARKPGRGVEKEPVPKSGRRVLGKEKEM